MVYLGNIIEEGVRGRIMILSSYTGLGLSIEDEVIEEIMTVDKICPHQVQDNKMSQVKPELSFFPEVNDPHQVKAIYLPESQSHHQNQSQKGCHNV